MRPRISPIACMDLVRFFIIIEITSGMSEWNGCYREPMTRAISPTDCMDLDRFFIVMFFIIYILLK